MRAVVVLPTPRGPEKTNDCAIRFAAIALRSVWVTPRWPIDVLEALRPPLTGEDLVVGHVDC